MITFLDEKDVEHGALATIKVTNAVNGERSLTGEIESGDYVLSNIERGWRLRFDNEFYVVTYAKPIDDGKGTHVTFDAVHQFFWDFDKSSIHDQLNDGSHTFLTYLDFIFTGSDYTYTVDPLLKVYAFEKQSFGYKSRLNLFNDIITASGVEFQVNGKVVRILEKTGTDLSTVVRKNFNMNELGIEKNIGDFVTYQKGFGAWVDENDHTKGRLVTEYTSPLASVYGKLEAEPLVDERYTQADNMVAALKANVDNSYSISVRLDMEDLTRAGYDYTQPIAGDYIMAINETLDFQEKIRIVSFTSEYDVTGQLIKHEVTCNDIGTVKKLSASYSLTKEQAQNASATVVKAVEMANKALVSADGKSTVYFGTEFPEDEPKGELHKGDSLYLTVGDTTKMYYWTGADWEELPIVNDVKAFQDQINDELKDIPDREEVESTINQKIATSKAEIKTQIDTAKSQAETNAKAYADEINQATAEVADRANAAADALKTDLAKVKTDLTATTSTANSAETSASEAKQQLITVANDLSKAKTDLQSAVNAVDTKATNLQSDLTKAKQDLTSQASQLTAQASAQSELTKRVSTVEETANGTKTTVSELSKTVDSNTKNITSVTARTKTVEDDLTSTKTTLSQVKTTADSTSQKTATLETGLNGLNARFENLQIGTHNLLRNTSTIPLGNTDSYNRGVWQILSGGNGTVQVFDVDDAPRPEITKAIRIIGNTNGGNKDIGQRTIPVDFGEQYTVSCWARVSAQSDTDSVTLLMRCWTTSAVNRELKTTITNTEWKRYTLTFTTESTNNHSLQFGQSGGGVIEICGMQFEKGNIVSDYSENDWNLSQKVAEYKQSAEQNYASLQSTVEMLDGTVQSNKATADQTAQGFKTRIESLETYKDGESTRANQYFESAKTETARQLTAERTAIAKDYVAKSTYTSDVTGIRNDLTATTATADTTKTNLANYQASNDKAVANLQSNLQTANGNISSLQTKVEAVPGQITSAVSAVEGKIPTTVGARNYIKSYGLTSTGWTSNKAGWKFEIISDSTAKSGQYLKATCTTASTSGGGFYKNLFDFSDGRFFGKQMTWAMDIKLSKAKYIKIGPEWGKAYLNINATTEWQRYSNTFTVATTTEYKQWIVYTNDNIWNVGDIVYIRDVQLEDGSIATSPVPAIEDTESDISQLSSELTQTKDGMTLLATKTELNTAKSDLQSGITTATNKANAAQSTADNNAKTISTHTTQISALNTGLSAKVSQTDFNTLSGRVTTAENNITAKANELSSKISSVEGQIPTTAGGRNYALKTGDSKSSTGGKLYDLSSAFDDIADNATLIIEFDWSVTAPTSTSKFRINRVITYSDGTANQWDNTIQLNNGDVATAAMSGHYSGAFKKIKYNSTAVSSRYLNLNQTTTSGTVTISNLSVRVGSLKGDWQPAPEDYDSKLATAQSEIKQTTDAISASVSALDNATVKSASLTINTDGIVMKAGKSTTDVANAIGSYFAVNQNAINLFSDKINVKGSMIVDGAITSAKIASKSINTAHLNGKIITADVISSNAVTADAIKAGAITTDKMTANSINGDRITAGTLDAAKIKAGSITASQIASGTITSAQIKTGTISAGNIATGTITGDNIKANSVDVSKISGLSAEYLKAKIENAMIDWMKGKTITAYNGNMAIDLQNGRISFKDGSNAVYRQTDDGIHTGFLHFEAGSQGGIYAAFGATSTRQGINSKSSEFAGIRCYRVSADGDSHAAKIDKIEVIGDAIQFGHGYRSDGQIGGGFIMDTAVFGNDTPYSLNRMVRSIEALWRILHDHARNTSYRFNDTNFINALNNEYNTWYNMHNI